MFGWLLLSSLCFAGVEYCSKRYVLDPCWQWLVILVVADILTVAAWLPALGATNELSIVGALWSVLSLTTTVLLGVVVFREPMTAVRAAGLVAAALAVFLLSKA